MSAANYACPDCGGRLRRPDPELPAYECTRCSRVVEEAGRVGA